MNSEWYSFVDGLKDGAGKLIKDELKGLIETAKNDGEKFIRKQGEKLERYMNQLANGEITIDDFETYVRDIQGLKEMETLKMKVAAKARAQRLANGIQDIIIDKLLKVIKI